jgi:cephalosporin hydroxylase
MDKKIIDKFHINWDKEKIWQKVTWLGIEMWKLPFDAFIIQELIFKIKPRYVIETGTNFGGSALFYASIMQLLGYGQVITIDKIEKKVELSQTAQYLFDNRIIKMKGNSIDQRIVKQIYSVARNQKNIVILDSWHSKEHVLKELNLYSSLVPVGSYLIVEDTHVNGHPIQWEYGEGPYEAVQEFLKTNSTFVVDKECEKLLITFNPNGFLKKVLHG